MKVAIVIHKKGHHIVKKTAHVVEYDPQKHQREFLLSVKRTLGSDPDVHHSVGRVVDVPAGLAISFSILNGVRGEVDTFLTKLVECD